ncbi:MAG: hypothetical protein M9916_00850 [Crocinitomicaceae bacterium]|nr:hypothetical protein [Crocinitomicaceae bacterium]
MLETIIINILSPILASGFTWMLARRKFKQEVKQNELENIEKAITIWREVSENLEIKLSNAQDEISKQNELISKQNDLIKHLTDEIELLRNKLKK